MLLALVFALPNFFGTDPALQVARKNRLPMDDFARQAVEQMLTSHAAAFRGSYIDDGKLLVRFSSVADQLKARDAVNENLDGGLRDRADDCFARAAAVAHDRPAADAAGPRPARRPVPALPGGREWRRGAAARQLRPGVSPHALASATCHSPTSRPYTGSKSSDPERAAREPAGRARMSARCAMRCARRTAT